MWKLRHRETSHSTLVLAPQALSKTAEERTFSHSPVQPRGSGIQDRVHTEQGRKGGESGRREEGEQLETDVSRDKQERQPVL